MDINFSQNKPYALENSFPQRQEQPQPSVAFTLALNYINCDDQARAVITRAVSQVDFTTPELSNWVKGCRMDLEKIQQIVEDQLALSEQLEKENVSQKELAEKSAQLMAVREEVIKSRSVESARFEIVNKDIQTRITEARVQVTANNWGQFAIDMSKKGQIGASAIVPIAAAYHYFVNCENSSLPSCVARGTVNPSLLLSGGAAYVTFKASQKILKATQAYQKASEHIKLLEEQQQVESLRHLRAENELSQRDESNVADTKICAEQQQRVEENIKELHDLKDDNTNTLNAIRDDRFLTIMQKQVKQLMLIEGIVGQEETVYEMKVNALTTFGDALVGIFHGIQRSALESGPVPRLSLLNSNAAQ